MAGGHRLTPRQITAAGGQVRDLSSVVAAMRRRGNEAAPLQREPLWDGVPFGPLNPLIPEPINPTRPTGRAEPRRWEYPQSWNLPGNGTHNHVPWKVLRDASNIPIIRDLIRITKNEIVSLDWDIAVKKSAILAEEQKHGSDEGRAKVEQKMRDRLAPEIDRCKTFWERPDRAQGYKFAEWIFQALEEILSVDALAIYPRYTNGGDLFSLEVLDGTTIKPLLDERGGRPLPPFPAYQQILYGFPRGEFTADWQSDDDAPAGITIPNGFPSDNLVYVRREVRTNSPYGCSPVEMCLVDIDLWMKRHAWLRAEYSDGVMPQGWLINDGVTSWTPEQLAEYERALNDLYAGQTEERQRYRMLPPGIKPDSMPAVDEKYRSDYDLWLLKLLCAHFDMTISELGFTENRGLGAAGYHEGQEDVQNRKNRRPFLKWLGEVLSDIAETHLKMPPELQFKWLGLEDEDEAAADLVVENRVKMARMTINEGRDAVGMPRYDFEEADQPMIVTQRGVVFIEGASKLANPGELVQPADLGPTQTDADGTITPQSSLRSRRRPRSAPSHRSRGEAGGGGEGAGRGQARRARPLHDVHREGPRPGVHFRVPDRRGQGEVGSLVATAEMYAEIVKWNENDDGTLSVVGRATGPDLDHDQQICDPAWLATAMPKWMSTGGNIREQHSSIAAGVATELEKTADDGWMVTADVVDPVSVTKVKRNVLSGFLDRHQERAGRERRGGEGRPDRRRRHRRNLPGGPAVQPDVQADDRESRRPRRHRL